MILKIQKFSLSTIFVLFPLLYFNSCTFEFIKPYAITLPCVLVFLLAWIISVFKEGVHIDVKMIIPIVMYILSLLVLMIFGVQVHSSILLSDISNALYLLIFMFVFIIYSDERRKRDRSVIIFVWFLDTIITCVYSIFKLIESPNLSRLLSTGSYHYSEEAALARGIASYGVIYGLVLVVLSLFYLVLHNTKRRWINISLMVLFITLLILAQFFFAIALVAVGIVWVLLVNNSNNPNQKPYRIIILAILVIVFIIGIPFALRFVADSEILGHELNDRLKEVILFLKNGDISGVDTAARLMQYTRSIRAFFSSYGLGKIVVPSVEVGTHSEWLDGFGNYGVLFLLCLVSLFTFRYLVLKRLPNEKSKQLYKILFVIYVITSLINTSMWAPITLDLCVITPLFCIDRLEEL